MRAAGGESLDGLRVGWLDGLSGRGTTRAKDAQGTPTRSHISPIKLVYEDKKERRTHGPHTLVEGPHTRVCGLSTRGQSDVKRTRCGKQNGRGVGDFNPGR